MIDKNLLVSTLRDLALLVETSDEREYAVLLEIGIGQIFKNSASSKRTNVRPKITPPLAQDIKHAAESLKYVQSRESGFELLERLELTRADLQQLARHLDLPVMREDNTHRLMEKIVESTVGSRLSSMAIRGE